MAKAKQIRLTPNETIIWRVIKLGNCFMRKHINNDAVECYRLLNNDMRPLRNVSINQFAKLKNLNRIIHRDNRWVYNANWHGNKNVNQNHKAL